jgi:CRP/FNR family cyclic AMP-dependent transcriptional regulator
MPLWVEIAGYIASALVASTFYIKTMLPLRIFAIGSNVAFMTYGYVGHLYPVLILHLFLFPLNIIRLHQIRKPTKDVREAVEGDFSLEWLTPYMSKTSYQKGTNIFTKGESANKMFYIHDGKIRLTDIGGFVQTKLLERGAVLGEIGIFAPDRKRTATAIAEEETDVYSIDEDKIVQLYYQNPKLAFYLVKLITRRLIENLIR